MPSENKQLETLKYILENSLHPEVLDSHPWTKSLVALEAATDNPELEGKTAGQQLVIAVAKFFTQMTPATPPRRGKRLDTNWGAFGLLAAQYFAPLIFGAPVPVSLRDAWGRIDQSILLFVFGKTDGAIPQEKKDAYKLVGGELEAAANSTLSDWHRKGLQQLTDALMARERFLSESLGVPAVIASAPNRASRSPRTRAGAKKPQASNKRWRIFLFASILIGLALIVVGGFKAGKVYNLTRVVRADATYIQKLISEPAPRLGKFKNIGSGISILRKDFAALKNETQPFFWTGSLLKGLPNRGGDLAAIEDLATLADSLLVSADLTYQTIAPLVDKGDLSAVNPTRLTEFLKQNQPRLQRAQQSLKQAEEARARLKVETLSPEVRDLILNDADPLMRLMQDGLTVAVELPRIMGATDEGPKTYLFLVENEDELRPTGGFITAASTILVKDGNISNLKFVNSGDLDNWQKIYPAAPWQLKEYMNSPVLVFRDANWFTNYPTTALYAEYLYSYASDHSVDGVIAFDQRLLIEILTATGPIAVAGASHPVDAKNVAQYMRESKKPDAQQAPSADWDNKAFLNKIAYALIEKIFSGDVQWETISATLARALNEHHILLQVDNPDMTALLARYHWDGAVQVGAGDFLMAVDSNIGFNKTNTVVESSAAYDVDLTDLSHPIGSLTIVHKNNAKENLICKQWLKDRRKGEESYPITDCYWNYLRIYKPAGTTLISATPQNVPAIWMINKQKNPGQVDILSEEISGAQAFGTLQVVPTGETLAVNFEFALPASILQTDAKQTTYALKVQKQPGTLATPITIRAHLPNNASIIKTPSGAIVENNSVLYETDLRVDLIFTVVFSTP
ncbi:MAG: DUF4012 domain-containing protein [Anaerolineales bacterium]|nr:DUF4012 domain-containing protein [Anaerolineales bacterium]